MGTRTIVAYVRPEPGVPGGGSWRTGILWNHNNGFLPPNEAEVRDCHTGKVHPTRQFQVLYPKAPLNYRLPDWHPDL